MNIENEICNKLEKTKENFTNFVQQEMTISEIGKLFEIKDTATRYWLSKFGLKTKYSKNKKTKWNKEELIIAIKTSETKAEALRKINLTTRPGNYDTLNKFIKNNNIDISHFTGKAHGKSKPDQKSLQEVMTKDSTYSRTNLKNRIIKENILTYKCEECELKPIWNNKKLILILDHKNGIGDDHRLENLRFLCPNCNSQQETFCRQKGSE